MFYICLEFVPNGLRLDSLDSATYYTEYSILLKILFSCFKKLFFYLQVESCTLNLVSKFQIRNLKMLGSFSCSRCTRMMKQSNASCKCNYR